MSASRHIHFGSIFERCCTAKTLYCDVRGDVPASRAAARIVLCIVSPRSIL
ncbi:hypothetical protein BSIN_1256 [Burkholderia singularis]|uniref:Uncharacterized protein n=1 Tax=Burkholderia singularis TaxID=1503053 RepID=A0A238HCW5_9BURK|nr:hypothetical protein BSIN_1256 [Burkholderia singularis]